MPPKQRSTPAQKGTKKTADDASHAAADPPSDDDVTPAKKAKKPQKVNKKGQARYILHSPWAMEGRRAAQLAMGQEPMPFAPFANPDYESDTESEDEHTDAAAPPEAKDTFVAPMHGRGDPRDTAVARGPTHPGDLASPTPCPRPSSDDDGPPRLAPHRAGFHQFIAYKLQNIPEHLWEDFETDCLAMVRRYCEQGRQPQQQQQAQRMSAPAASGVYGQPPSQDPSFH